MQYTHETRDPKPAVIHTAPFPTPDDTLTTMMTRYLAVRKLSLADATFNGWYSSSSAGDSLPRIVIPATSQHLAHHYWQSRLMDPEDETSKRYQSPKAARLDSVVVCYPVNPLPGEYVIVEGPMCSLTAAELGRTGIAIMGNKPPTEVLYHVAKLCHGGRALFLADSDAVQEAAVVVGQLAGLGVNVKLRLMRGEKDLAASSRRLRFQLVTWDD